MVLIFNGEIYNYIELREDLKSSGYNFETDSDTEVLIKSFDLWGTDCFNKFNGMWSIVIYDTSKLTDEDMLKIVEKDASACFALSPRQSNVSVSLHPMQNK